MRIVDANTNRAREALRVMEEYARLGLDDASLSAAMKETRHSLAQAVAEFEGCRTAGAPDGSKQESTCLSLLLARGEVGGEDKSVRAEASGSLVRSRDIAGDVGCHVTAPAEYERSDAAHVAVVAGKRLSEALRAVEEYGKTVDPDFALAVEKIRYRGYELERRLHVTMSARERLGRVRLYVILTESLCRGDWFATAEAALSGGVDCLQLREKNLADRELLDRATRLGELCRNNGCLFIVNDRPDIAVLSGADGVHLGQDDMALSHARRIMPPTCLVGVSTHSVEQARSTAVAAPDYIAVGPMFATDTKPQDHVAGPETLAAVRKLTSLPLTAIGGIGADSAVKIMSAGADSVCVCTAVISQPDPAAAATALRIVIDRWASEAAPCR